MSKQLLKVRNFRTHQIKTVILTDMYMFHGLPTSRAFQINCSHYFILCKVATQKIGNITNLCPDPMNQYPKKLLNKAVPCYIHPMTFFRKKPKGTHCWMWILNNAPTPIYYAGCAIPISYIRSNKKINFMPLRWQQTIYSAHLLKSNIVNII